jgi:predicted secreted acid phosphatase
MDVSSSAEPTGTTAPAAARRSRMGRSLPVVAGALIAAGGLVFGGLAAANANSASSAPQHQHHVSIRKQAAQVRHADAGTPKNGNKVQNVNVLEDRIEHYYGAASAKYKGIGAVTIPAKNGKYAKQMRGIAKRAGKMLVKAKHSYHGSAKPAVVFDIDDTLLNTYDYTLSAQFGYDPTENAKWVEHGAFPAVFGMPKLLHVARHHGYHVYFITGRPESQRAATRRNLKKDGYGKPTNSHLFLKQTTPPSYLNCPSSGCSTIQYKSGTRKHIASGGYQILADFGDQYSDLLGGHAGHKVKLPNPMYYIP